MGDPESDDRYITMFTEINKCRISGSTNLLPVLSLGEQYLTGVFPKSPAEKLTKGPLDLVWCPDSGLLQLKQSYNLEEMYGDNYGYRSGLNSSMVRHLQQKVLTLERIVRPADGALVIDIGSNDATALRAYAGNYQKVGVDPAGEKFRAFYPDDTTLISDFFSADAIRSQFPNQKAEIITAIAMFYDLEDPISFVREIEQCLSDNGVWHFEQSYMPSMLHVISYDTICHEHLEFYSFKVVKSILEACGLKVVDVQLNSINGGSFAVTASKEKAAIPANEAVINWLLKQEDSMALDTIAPYKDFAQRVFRHRQNLTQLIDALVADGKRIFGYGASTKGNVLLQFCGMTPKQIPYIAEVNEDKFGSFTPGTNIPIISEAEAKAMKPDYFLVLPWHFKDSILKREEEYLAQGGQFIFPLPEIEIVTRLTS